MQAHMPISRQQVCNCTPLLCMLPVKFEQVRIPCIAGALLSSLASAVFDPHHACLPLT